MTTIYGVYAPMKYEPYDECGGPEDVLVEQFTSEAAAEQYIEDYPRLAYAASSDEDGWLAQFWMSHRAGVVKGYKGRAEGKVGRVPRYVTVAFGGETAEQRTAGWRQRTISDAVSRIEEADRTVARVKADAMRARKTDPQVWIKRHFPKGAGFFIRPTEVRESVPTYEDIRFDPIIESYLRGHKEG